MSALATAVRRLLREAVDGLATTPAGPEAAALLARFDGPLRVAIAGRVKAGKSTLLNALVGDELAPTDAGECTRIVTWYRDGLGYGVTAELTDGTHRVVRFRRDGGAIDLDLEPLAVEDVARLDVEWPSATLRDMTLVDTPGIGAIRPHGPERTVRFLVPDDEQEAPADAVVYLMRHVHGDDVRFLEAFHDDEAGHATPVNAVGVLSRADEIGGGRLDSMASAARIADRYRADAELRRLCQTVLPVAGLLAQAATTLREREVQALRSLAALPAEEAEALLRSVDRFVAGESSVPLAAVERAALLQRFGLFGVRLSHRLLVSGACTNGTELAAELRRRSGLDGLRAVLGRALRSRSELLKSRSALAGLDRVLRSSAGAEAARLAAEVERLRAGAHELAELRLVTALRAGAVAVDEREAAEIERLLAEPTCAARLGLPPDAGPEAVRAELLGTVARWRRRAEHPLSERSAVEAARVVVRTCEGLLVATEPLAVS